MSTKFFVYGGGRWREISLDTGAVSGWENSARFVYCRGKRLHLARQRSVLAGLRDLAAGMPTSVRNGPRLTQRRHVSRQTRKMMVPLGSCRQCCQHKTNSSTKVIELPATPASVVKQTQTDNTLQPAEPSDRNCKNMQAGRELASDKVPLQKLSSKATIRKKLLKKSTQSVIKVNHSSESSDNSVESSQSIILVPRHHVRASVKPNDLINSRSTTINQKYPNPKELKGDSTSTDEDEPLVVPKTRNKTKRRDATVHSDNGLHQRSDKWQSNCLDGNIDKFISKIIGTNAVKNSQKTDYTRCSIREKAVSQESEYSSGNESSVRSFAPNKELLIEESDVIALRMFLEKNSSEDVVLRFDSDDAYKRNIFYTINPLVRLERCPRITEMSRSRGVLDTRLVDFASQLGLQSVSESSTREPVRYRTRHSLRSNHDDTDKENLNNSTNNRAGPASRLRRSNRVLGEKSPEKATVPQKAPKSPVESNVTTSSDSEDAFVSKRSPQKPIVKRGFLQKPIVEKNSLQKPIMEKSSLQKQIVEKSSLQKLIVKNSSLQKTIAKKPLIQSTTKTSRRGYRGGVQEYSTLEDHAIVRWLSEGNRAARVKGNAVWWDLHDQYYALTGQNRSWQSLKNRYLRYVLPALGKLSLSPGRAAALRAAAATGEMRNKRRQPRRNSIFDQTQVEAASARAPDRRLRTAIPVEESDSEDSPPHKRLRSSIPGRSARPEPDLEAKTPTRSRTRKLFNPNAVL